VFLSHFWVVQKVIIIWYVFDLFTNNFLNQSGNDASTMRFLKGSMDLRFIADVVVTGTLWLGWRWLNPGWAVVQLLWGLCFFGKPSETGRAF
jgi:hypothetical protein